METNINLSIVIPVYNSATNLKKLVNEIYESLNNKNILFELILVNDCSKDQSWDAIVNLCNDYKWVKGIDLRKNFGQHGAIFAGLNFALGETLVLMDDDLQHSPEDIYKIYSEIKKGNDVCYAFFLSRRHSFFKILASKINNIFASVLLNKPFNLYLSPFKGFNNFIRNEIIKYKGSSIYIDGIILSITNNISSIQVMHYDTKRTYTKSNYTFLKLIKLWSQTVIGYSTVPLRVATFLGIIFSLISLIMIIVIVIMKVIGVYTPLGWASAIVTVLFIGGIQLVSLGIIGEYLAKVHYSISNNVQFSISKTINFK